MVPLALLIILPATLGQQIQLPKPRLVIAGMSGSGKSTLANVLLGSDVHCQDCTFEWCADTDSCTKKTSYAKGNWLGKGLNFTVVDTPGFGDSDGEDAENMEEMMKVFKEEVKEANAILLLFKGNIVRFQDGLTTMVRQMTMLFGEKIWKHVIIGISFWAYDEYSIEKRNENCENTHRQSMCHNEDWIVNEINRQLQEKVHITHKLPAVFIDSWSQTSKHVDVENEQKYFKQETQRLLDLIQAQQAFRFRTINDILKENEKMKDDIKWLEYTVKKNITDIQQSILDIENIIPDIIERNKMSIVNVTELLAKDEQIIRENTNRIEAQHNQIQSILDIKNIIPKTQSMIEKNKMSIVHVKELLARDEQIIYNNTNRISAATESVSKNAEKVISNDHNIKVLSAVLKAHTNKIKVQHDQISDLIPAPVGTIIAWVSHVKDGTATSLPSGWVVCDGQKITEGIWKDHSTPNLNTAGYFLRGSLPSQILEFEDHKVVDMEIDDYYQGIGMGTCKEGGNVKEQKMIWTDLIPHDPFCHIVRKLSTRNAGNVGSETRPKNMRVIYIIKIK